MPKILVINSGSATLKFKVFSLPQMQEEVSGIVERIGIDGSFLEMKGKLISKQVFVKPLTNHGQAFEEVAKALKDILSEITVIGHRVVHGGCAFTDATLVNPKILAELKKLSHLAPLHNPINLMCLERSMQIIPSAKQYAVFDTGFYKTIPDYAYLYSLPGKFCSEYGIRRYGFHGVSHKYAALEAARLLKKPISKLKIISCHLGSGCSITATKYGNAIDTSMGFTPLEGLTMSTRAGDMDASVPLFLIEQLGMKVGEVSKLLNKESGLLGISGTMDMREILTAAGHKVVGYKVDRKFSAEEKNKCSLALKIFIYDIVRYIGQFATIMKGVDAIVFTGGIGERSPAVRSLILKDLEIFKGFKSLVVEADEELMIAKEIAQSVKITKVKIKA